MGGSPRDSATRRFTGRRNTCGWRSYLLNAPLMQNCNAVPQGQGFAIVVCYIDNRGPEGFPHGFDLGSHFVAQSCIQVGQRFVHEKDRGLPDQGASQRYALSLPSTQSRRPAVQKRIDSQKCGLPEAQPARSDLHGSGVQEPEAGRQCFQIRTCADTEHTFRKPWRNPAFQGVRFSIGWPLKRIVPEVRFSTPAIILRVVVLPAPDSPRITKNSLSRISRLRSRMASWSP